MKAKIAKLRSRIVLQTPTRTQNETTFAYETSWSTTPEVWANIKGTGGLTFQRGDNLEPVETHIITIRYREGITRDTRVKYGTRYFRIHKISSVEEGKAHWLKLHCEEMDDIS